MIGPRQILCVFPCVTLLKEILKVNGVTNGNHAGNLEFGPDGYLYVGMGDTGPQGDPEGHGQNLSTLLGKILRIDVDHPDSGKPYSIPSDNPFVGRQGARPEIWAYGLREPWRFSFDPLTQDFWVGDVGQDLYEEIDIVRKGENYGWNVMEGFERYSNKYRRDGETFVPPIFSWTRKYGAHVPQADLCIEPIPNRLFMASIFSPTTRRKTSSPSRKKTAFWIRSI
ncbi:MAG TPA: PQQ-dependent sugar dehydrogenase [Tepidisphaeraceae bacterium]|jgi:glucose/arabinose dehydrogenase